MQPGCYANLNAHGKAITLQSGGLFILTGGANFNGATVTGTNVTIYIASGATTNFNNTTVNISAPTGGTYANVALFQAPGNSNTINLNGSSDSITGLLYAPAAQINYNGGENGYMVIVAAYANFNGSSNNQNYGSPPMGSTIVHNVVLAQ